MLAMDFALVKSEYYSLIPTFLIYNDKLIDFNIAAKTLFGYNINFFRNQSLHQFFKTQFQKIDGDILFPRNGALKNENKGKQLYEDIPRIKQTECRFYSDQFGNAQLCCTALALIDKQKDRLAIMNLFWEILNIDQKDLYRQTLKNNINYTLTWEAYALSYDRILPKLSFYKEVIKRHIRTIVESEAKKIIDVGAGTGNVAIPLLKSGCIVYAVDLSRAMLDHLRLKTSKRYEENLFVIEQDAANLNQLRQESFDGANILLSLFDMNKPDEALSNIIKVLKPGGIIVITEPKRNFDLEPLIMRAEDDLRREGSYESLQIDWLRVMNVNRSIDPSKRSPLFIEDIQNRLSHSGFEITKVEDSHLGNCSTVTAIKK
jgi:ubiquinone/menaquinone biosynthesis C-methylase UbiE